MLWSPQLLSQPRKPATAAGAAVNVTIDALWSDTGTPYSQSNPSATSLTVANGLTIGSGLTNSALIAVVINLNTTQITGMTANWDAVGTNQSLTLLGTGTGSPNTLQVFVLGLRSPTAGAKHFDLAWTGSSQVAVSAISLYNVAQANDAAAFTGFASSGAATPLSLSVTSAAGDMVFAGYGCATNFTSTNNTQWFIDNTGNNWASAANYATGAGTVTLTGSPGHATQGVAAGINVHAG